MGLAPRGDRVRRRCGFGSGARTGQRLAGSVPHVSGPGLAPGRFGRGGARRNGQRRDRRVVLRFRLFPRGPLLDRLCVPGRCQNLRLAAAVRRDRASGGARGLHWPRPRVGASLVDARPDPAAHPRLDVDRVRMAAGTFAERVSVECLRLCADRLADAGTELGSHRTVGTDVLGRISVREPRRARRRSDGSRPSLARAGARARRARGARRLWGRAVGARAGELRVRRAAADHAAQPAAGRQVQLRGKATSDEPISDALAARRRRRLGRAQGCDASDLAGIGIPVFSDA